jgi:Leucine-rich repeat (LRR) protein
VLDLEDAEQLESKNIEGIGRLFNLRYLGLGGEHVTELPESVGELQFLETLEVRRTNVRRLPPAASRFRKLARLLTKLLDDIPDGIELMQELQELSMINVNSRRSLDLVAELVKLRQLRALGLKWCIQDELHGEIDTCRTDFVSSLNKIKGSGLESLFLQSGDACSLDFLAGAWVPPRLLQKLVVKSLNYYFPATPAHLGSCTNLTYLEIAINLSRQEDLSIIANLPELTTLKLFTKEKPIFIRHGFLCLKVFWFDGWGLNLVFEEAAAMPQLRKLHVSFKLLAKNQAQQGFDVGLNNISALKQVYVNIDCQGAGVSEVDAMESAIRERVYMHPNKPALELSKHNYIEEKATTDENM